jgi:hypothetical protein
VAVEEREEGREGRGERECVTEHGGAEAEEGDRAEAEEGDRAEGQWQGDGGYYGEAAGA